MNSGSNAKWNTEELQRDFTVLGFAYGLVMVQRKSDGVKGSLEFNHQPRIYYNFMPDSKVSI